MLQLENKYVNDVQNKISKGSSSVKAVRELLKKVLRSLGKVYSLKES